MKAVFVIRQGALVEGIDARCTLRCGASAGLRMLLDLDLRLIVIEAGACHEVAIHGGGHLNGGDHNDSDHDDGYHDGGDHDGGDHDGGDHDGGFHDNRPGYRRIDHAPLHGSCSAWTRPEAAERSDRTFAGNEQSARPSGRLPDNGRRQRRGDPPAAVKSAAHHDHAERGASMAASLSIHDTVPDIRSGPWRRLDAIAAGDDVPAPARCQDSSDGSGADDGLAVPEQGFDNTDIGGDMFAREKLFGGIGAGETQRIGIRQDRAQTADESATKARAAGGCDDRFAGRHTRTQPPGGGTPIIDRLADLLFREQLILTAYYCCTHSTKRERAPAQAACFCLPPQPGLLLQAACEHGIDLQSSWLIGARLDDIEAGNRSGCRTILIDNGTETTWRLGRARVPTRIAPDLHGAALLINNEGERMQR